MKTYQQLTQRQRYQIWTGVKQGLKQREIAEEIGRDRSSISREIRRNRTEEGYNPVRAEALAQKRRREKGRQRIRDEVWTEVDERLRANWSPEQISGRRRVEGQYPVSHEWIYQHIYSDKIAGGDLHTYLRCRKKRRKRYGSYRKRGFPGHPLSIDERPAIVEQKSRIGDMEIDTIVGKGRHQGIITMVDRRSKLLRMKKVAQKTATLVARAICNELKDLTVHTLTSDNGREFSAYRKIERKLRADYYFCHPYSSWERGLNENTNGLIRQFFPKHMKFDDITDGQIKIVEDNLNNRPRKALAFRTPNEVYFYEQEVLTRGALTN